MCKKIFENINLLKNDTLLKEKRDNIARNGQLLKLSSRCIKETENTYM